MAVKEQSTTREEIKPTCRGIFQIWAVTDKGPRQVDRIRGVYKNIQQYLKYLSEQDKMEYYAILQKEVQ